MWGAHGRRPKILIVEDDHALASMYRTALTFEGFDVAVAPDGLSALRHIDEEHFDLVVLDLSLPVVRGEEILREIKAAPDLGTTPVIVVTGEPPRQAVEAARTVLRKPCAPERLLSAIDRHLKPAA